MIPTKSLLEGGCDCRAVRYRLESGPLFVHCCHCRWCQRESGASFALNAMIETSRVTNLGVAPELVHTPSASGRGQQIARCATCHVALWSHYAGAGPVIAFVRVGTLDDPDRLPPDIHIYTASKQPWIVLPPGTPAVPEYYDRDLYWPAASLARRKAIVPLIEAYQASLRQTMDDPSDLGRFLRAQESVHETALAELRAGRKRSHWMWFVFPQLAGLGRSPTARLYAIRGEGEARAYLAHPVLGPRLIACFEALLSHADRTAHEILGSPDDVKLRSCATLFAAVSPVDSVFEHVLQAFYGSEPDPQTLVLLDAAGSPDAEDRC